MGSDSVRKAIFLVDDDLTNLTVGIDALEERYDVLTLSSGSLLLKMLEKNVPDLILLDIDMPGMDGYEAMRVMKSNPAFAHIPVIFLTAKSDGGSELEGLSLGAVDYIAKPFSEALLLKRIEMHLLLESQRRILESQTQELTAQKMELIRFNNDLQGMVDAKIKTVLELQDTLLMAMAELVECRDDVTGGHIERTRSYLGALLDAMIKCGLYAEEVSKWDIKLVLQSAQLHDVGKIAVKDGILNKLGKLSYAEFEEIKKHASFGGALIEKIIQNTSEQTFLEYAKVFAVTHHERWDGSGYPSGLRGEEIPLLGRLMAVADVYDALRSDRPYKMAYSHEEAVKVILEGRGAHFDPRLVDLFMSISGEFAGIADALASRRVGIGGAPLP
ncbi:MAG: response regulator [Chitinispirillales bacterium]|jgi:putative two-component system response regulator|nr:response regulator [Chitinispirillales bacterium]